MLFSFDRTFADAYIDLSSGKLTSTVSFKIVDDLGMSSINEEANATPYAIQSIDLNLGRL